MLYTYMQDVQRFTRDGNQQLLNPQDMISYINRARRDIAGRTQCLRVLTPIAGSVAGVTMTNVGSGYTNPTVTISPPDSPSGQAPYPSGSQATVSSALSGGEIIAIGVTYGGYGYFQPQVTITDPTGTGATTTVQTTLAFQTITNQEVYSFSNVNLSAFPGFGSVFNVHSISMLYANYRYSLPVYPFSVYQALIRQYPQQYYYVPTVASQYGQGANGSLYLYPIASQPYQMEWDCFCLPQDLIDDRSVEAIPQPWQDAVSFYATHLAYLDLQNLNAAEYYRKLYDDLVHRFSAYARSGRMTNPYGRY